MMEDDRRNSGNRKKFSEKKGNYSPSANYNYNPGGNFAGQHQNQHQNQQQHHPRRRTDRYRRDVYNLTEKLVKQNDVMIRLLKEIKDKVSSGQGGHSKGKKKKGDSGKNSGGGAQVERRPLPSSKDQGRVEEGRADQGRVEEGQADQGWAEEGRADQDTERPEDQTEAMGG